MPDATGRAARLVWALFAAVAGAMALLAIVEWTDALLDGRPVLYGEGAVAHAALLFRLGDAYRDASGAVAANYPPLYVGLAGIGGDPFRVGRAITMLSALAGAALLAWRARAAGGLAAFAMGAAWLALAPVAIWGAAVKPDLLAVALTLGGVVLLERSHGGRGAVVAGELLALAAWAKPTALLPLAAVLVWAFATSRRAFVLASGGAVAVAIVAMAHAASIGLDDVWRHVVVWNALPWSAEQATLVLVLFAATVGMIAAVAAVAGAANGIALAYLIGALAVAVLAGREGATINYLLDLAAATMFALARAAPRLRVSGALPVTGAVQLAVAVALLTPFGIVPGRERTTGAWGQPERAATIRALGPGTHLVEDSGLLLAERLDPPVDDLFLWSRLVRSGLVLPDPVLDAVRARRYASIVSEADLARLDAAPAYERARWDPALVRAVLDGYALERATGILWVYRPR